MERARPARPLECADPAALSPSEPASAPAENLLIPKGLRIARAQGWRERGLPWERAAPIRYPKGLASKADAP